MELHGVTLGELPEGGQLPGRRETRSPCSSTTSPLPESSWPYCSPGAPIQTVASSGPPTSLRKRPCGFGPGLPHAHRPHGRHPQPGWWSGHRSARRLVTEGQRPMTKPGRPCTCRTSRRGPAACWPATTRTLRTRRPPSTTRPRPSRRQTHDCWTGSPPRADRRSGATSKCAGRSASTPALRGTARHLTPSSQHQSGGPESSGWPGFSVRPLRQRPSGLVEARRRGPDLSPMEDRGIVLSPPEPTVTRTPLAVLLLACALPACSPPPTTGRGPSPGLPGPGRGGGGDRGRHDRLDLRPGDRPGVHARRRVPLLGSKDRLG